MVKHSLNVSLSKILPWLVGAYAVSTLGSMATMSIGAVVLIAALCLADPAGTIRGLKAEVKSKAGKAYFRASLVLFLVCVLSLLVAKVHPYRIDGRWIDIPFWSFWKDIVKGWYLFWPLLLAVALGRLSENQQRAVLKAWVVTFFVLGVIAVFQYFYGWPRHQVIPEHDPLRYHVTLFLGHHLSVASVLIFPFFAVLDGFVRDRKLFHRGFLALALALGAWALIGTYSRALWIGLPVGLLVYVLWRLPSRARWMTAALLVGVAAGLTRVPAIESRIRNPMGITERLELWEANLSFLKDRPLTGVGWRMNEAYSALYLEKKHPQGEPIFIGHAHNNLLEFLGGTGLLGALAWLGWWTAVFSLVWRSRDASPWGFSQGLLCALIVFHINGLTQVNFWEGKVQHQLAWGLAWVLVWMRKGRTQ